MTPETSIERRWAVPRPLLVTLAVLLLAAAFALLASEVGEGETQDFDHALLLNAQAWRAAHPWFAEIMRDLSGLGSTVAMTLYTVATCGYLLLSRRYLNALLIAASIGSASLLVGVLKTAFGRGRPDIAFAELVQSGLSFPSGHASMSAVVFLTLGALLADTHARQCERLYIVSAAALLALMVGISRVALGVHWATDVLGGWAFGTAWAIAWLLLVHTRRARRLAKNEAPAH
jgi:undecaprenyl-diphosphatase